MVFSAVSRFFLGRFQFNCKSHVCDVISVYAMLTYLLHIKIPKPVRFLYSHCKKKKEKESCQSII